MTNFRPYTVNPHAWGRPNHARNEAELRGVVENTNTEWWFNPLQSVVTNQELYTGLLGPISGPVAVVRFNKSLMIVQTCYNSPDTFTNVRRLINRQGYTQNAFLSPIF